MPIAVTGSVATDHLMTFPGRFRDALLDQRLDKVSVSFLVDDLVVRRGGCAANICYGLSRFGLRPVLLAAVGEDIGEYRVWLEGNGVDCGFLHVSASRRTAQFLCTTDRDEAQIASFYPGAMAEAEQIALAPVAEAVGELDLVVISPDHPAAMLRHTDECRERGYRFAADPSQQLAVLDGPDVRRLIEGADLLFANEYESDLIEAKSGWTAQQILDRVATRVTTLGAAGVRIERSGEPPLVVPAVSGLSVADPTGVGDGFRAGFLGALAQGADLAAAACAGCVHAAYVIEAVGPQEYGFSREEFAARLRAAYGDAAS